MNSPVSPGLAVGVSSVSIFRLTVGALGELRNCKTPVASKALTRFRADWVWDGNPALLQSRCVDETGYVQPALKQLREVRGTRSIYHNNAIQTWQVLASGEVRNVQT